MGRKKDISGMRFGMWTVLAEDGKNKHGAYKWICRCDCGTVRSVAGHTLRLGKSTCCGCNARNRIEASKKATVKHNGRKDRLYNVWRGVIDRCCNRNSKYYSRYGGRGISICEEWRHDYSKFREWALSTGYDDKARKYECTLDRVNNDGGYYPENCRWVNMKGQCNNRSSNHRITYNNVSHTISEWSRITGVRKDTLRRRIFKYGWSVERALTEPTHKYRGT